jgi:hypothetical protein
LVQVSELHGQAEEDASDAFAAVEKQRKGGCLYWTGLRPTRLAVEVGSALPLGADGIRVTCKYQSWAMHHDVLVLRDFSVEHVGGTGLSNRQDRCGAARR